MDEVILTRGICMECGQPAVTSYSYECAEHEDPYNGDGPDD